MENKLMLASVLLKILDEKLSLNIYDQISDIFAFPYQESYSATQIGKKLNNIISAKQVNKYLQIYGFQEKDNKKNWIPTKVGQKYAFTVPYAYKKSSEESYSVKLNLKWKPEIVTVLNEKIQQSKYNTIVMEDYNDKQKRVS